MGNTVAGQVRVLERRRESVNRPSQAAKEHSVQGNCNRRNRHLLAPFRIVVVTLKQLKPA